MAGAVVAIAAGITLPLALSHGGHGQEASTTFVSGVGVTFSNGYAAFEPSHGGPTGCTNQSAAPAPATQDYLCDDPGLLLDDYNMSKVLPQACPQYTDASFTVAPPAEYGVLVEVLPNAVNETAKYVASPAPLGQADVLVQRHLMNDPGSITVTCDDGAQTTVSESVLHQ